jgi:fructose-1,6-bisphosphatase I
MRRTPDATEVVLTPSVENIRSSKYNHHRPDPRKTLFKRFMEVELWRRPELETLFPIMCRIEQACRDISRLSRRIHTDSLEGFHGGESTVSVNVQGEDQRKLDVIANRVLKTALCCSGKISVVASEEEDLPTYCSAVVDNAAFE